jgi:hypothetical protein
MNASMLYTISSDEYTCYVYTLILQLGHITNIR